MCPAAGAAAGRLALWNLRAFKRVSTFSLAGDPALGCLAWAADGRRLLAAGADGTARVFDVAARTEARSLQPGSPSPGRVGGNLGNLALGCMA